VKMCYPLLRSAHGIGFGSCAYA